MAAIGPICDALVTVGTWASRAAPVAKFFNDVMALFRNSPRSTRNKRHKTGGVKWLQSDRSATHW